MNAAMNPLMSHELHDHADVSVALEVGVVVAGYMTLAILLMVSLVSG